MDNIPIEKDSDKEYWSKKIIMVIKQKETKEEKTKCPQPKLWCILERTVFHVPMRLREIFWVFIFFWGKWFNRVNKILIED